MMNRIVLAGFIDKESKNGKGIFRKMTDQAAGFEKIGFEADIFCLQNQQIFTQLAKVPDSYGKVNTRFLFYRELQHYLQCNTPDILYLRYPFGTTSLLHFLQKLRCDKPKIRIVIEWPTFPYHREFKGMQKVKYFIDQYFQKKILAYLDLAVVIGNPHHFQHVPTLQISNGFQCPKVQSLTGTKVEKNAWIAVGHWQDWHGLDRLIRGLHDYYQQGGQENIQIRVIGEGPASARYKKMATRLSLQKNIHFYSSVSEELQAKWLSESSLAVGVLGSHKKGLVQHAPLKHRMYACAGLPFIYSTSDPDFDEQPFALQLAASNSVVPISSVLAWANKGGWSKNDIRDRSKDILEWSVRCKKIITALMEDDPL